jgi:hypothetical protein
VWPSGPLSPGEWRTVGSYPVKLVVDEKSPRAADPLTRQVQTSPLVTVLIPEGDSSSGPLPDIRWSRDA